MRADSGNNAIGPYLSDEAGRRYVARARFSIATTTHPVHLLAIVSRGLRSASSKVGIHTNAFPFFIGIAASTSSNITSARPRAVRSASIKASRNITVPTFLAGVAASSPPYLHPPRHCRVPSASIVVGVRITASASPSGIAASSPTLRRTILHTWAPSVSVGVGGHIAAIPFPSGATASLPTCARNHIVGGTSISRIVVDAQAPSRSPCRPHRGKGISAPPPFVLGFTTQRGARRTLTVDVALAPLLNIGMASVTRSPAEDRTGEPRITSIDMPAITETANTPEQTGRRPNGDSSARCPPRIVILLEADLPDADISAVPSEVDLPRPLAVVPVAATALAWPLDTQHLALAPPKLQPLPTLRKEEDDADDAHDDNGRISIHMYSIGANSGDTISHRQERTCNNHQYGMTPSLLDLLLRRESTVRRSGGARAAPYTSLLTWTSAGFFRGSHACPFHPSAYRISPLWTSPPSFWPLFP